MARKKLKILFVIKSINIGGGAERVITYLINNLIRYYQISLIVFEKGNNEHKVKCNVYYGKTFGKSFIKRLFSLINWISLIKKVVKKEKPDVIISFMEEANIASIIAKSIFRFKSKLIICVRNFLSLRYKNKIFKFILKKLYPKANLIVANSKEMAKDLNVNFSIPNNKIKVIYNPIDLKLIHSLMRKKLNKKEEQIFKKNKVIINVGRLNEQKGQKYLIYAVKKLKLENRLKDIKLVIVGDGPYRELLLKIIKKEKLENDVYLLGKKINPYKYMYNSYLFILTSLWEGFPNVILEAMACGLPVISSDCKSGPKEILSKKSIDVKDIVLADYGILIPTLNNNEKSFIDLIKKAIALLIENKELYVKYKKKVSLRVKKFKIENIIKDWRSIIAKLEKGLNF